MGSRMVPTAIDLSNLGLNTIEENEEEFSIGCMTTLRQLEQHEGLNAYTGGAVRNAVKNIVDKWDPRAFVIASETKEVFGEGFLDDPRDAQGA